MTEFCTCNRCGWVHFAVTREYAETESAKFMAYYETLTPEQRENYGKPPINPMPQYERCFSCGQTDGDFRLSNPDDCPRGCTIQPVIWEQE